MSRVVVILLGGFVVALVSRVLQARAGKKNETLEEASSNFEGDDIVPLFRRIATLIDEGFGEKQIDEIRALASSLEVDEEKELAFRISYRRTKTQARVGILMSDIDSPDVTIRTSPELASRIQEQMTAFQDERGR